MLDQNTDRMWFVIGAVIVGAAIIFIANGTLPDLFASVSESFDTTATDAEKVIQSLEPNLVSKWSEGTNLARMADFRARPGSTYSYNSSTGIGTVRIDSEHEYKWKGIYPHTGIQVRAGERMRVSFEIYSEGVYPFHLDLNNTAPGLYGNDWRINHPQGEFFVTAPGEWFYVETEYIASDDAPVYEDSSTIMLNHDYRTDEEIELEGIVEVQIRDLKYELAKPLEES